MRRTMLAAAALSCVACQSYTVIPPQAVVPAQAVRLTLKNPDGGPYGRLGSRVITVNGRVSGVTDTTLVVDVTELTRSGGAAEDWGGEPITFTRRDVDHVERLAPSLSKSLALSVLLVGGAFAAHTALGSSDALGGRTGGAPVTGQ